jgi:hypothetical protein
MFSLYNILTIAKFEVKTLFRSWFFRVFAILSLGILGFMNILWFTDAIDILPWGLRAIPGSVPYLNMMFYNVAQAIIAVFMASDFLKRDYKLNTTEVIYMRNMANGDYVLGKTLGILYVFISLNLLLYVFALVVNFVFADVPVYWNAYVLYFLLMSLPSLVFIVGLSFISMILVRNQALTFILILGYVAISLFFLSTKVNFLFDYMAWYIPLSFSDFVGFTELGPVITQRLIYFALGLAFIFITIFSIKRLPQSPFLTKFAMVFSFVLIVGAGFLGFSYVSDYSQIKSTRIEMIALNDQLKDIPVISVKNCNLDVLHNGNSLHVSASLEVKNESFEKIEKMVFSLNPRFLVEGVKLDGSETTFDREHHILTVNPSNALAPQGSTEMLVKYSGNISALSSYLDVAKEQEELINNVGPYKLPKKFGFITPKYVLLTQENLWYPIPGSTHGSEIFPKWKKDFFEFAVNVKTNKDLTAISQGDLLSESNGEFSFKSSQPLPQLSLVIGDYVKRSIVVDSVEYSLYTHPKHNYFEPYFSEISDTLGSLIRDEKQEVETILDVDYPFQRLSLIEVPSQYFTYTRRLGVVEERVQPEQMFLPENGASLNNVDFKRSAKYYKRRSKDRNQEVSEKEMQTSMFNRFISEMRGDSRGRRHGGGTGANFKIIYSVVPFYYNYVTHLEAPEYPLLSTAFESFLNSTLGEEESPFARFFRGLTDAEKANLLLRENSLADLLKDEEHFDQINHVIKVKSDFLFKRLNGKIGDEAFTQFLAELLKENQFKPISMENFLGLVQDRFDIDFLSWLEPWKNDTTLPGLFITNVSTYQVLDGNMTRYQTKFTLINEKEVDGLVYVEFRGGGRGGPGFGPPPVAEQRVILMEPKQAKDVYILLDDEPRGMTINTILAENLPTTFMQRIQDVELNKNAVPFDGEKILDQLPPFTLPGEYIVDNEDPGFTFTSGEHKSMLQKMLNIQDDDEEEYTPFRFYRPPTEWRKTTFDDFYGRYIHSASFIRAGDGDQKATWTVDLKSSGQYEVYAYNPQIKMRFGRGRDRGGSEYVGELHFNVYHDDGVEEVLLDTPNAEQGWNLMGAFYLTAGEAKVEITNESNKRLVVADAVKWVKK